MTIAFISMLIITAPFAGFVGLLTKAQSFNDAMDGMHTEEA